MINNIKFIIDSVNIRDKIFTRDNLNPGVGGTQYLTVLLANQLAHRYQELDVVIYTVELFEIENKAKNLSIILIKLSDWVADISTGDTWILTVSNLNSICDKSKANLKDKFLLWSHHPSDWRALSFRNNSKGLISTGEYQFASNYGYHKSVGLIENLLFLNRNELKSHSLKKFRVMFLGALVPVKGFHELLNVWDQIAKCVPNAELHVVGGSSLYGITDSIDLPCDSDYAEKLKLIARKRGVNLDDIHFYGSLGFERFALYSKMDLAVVNPLGISESFSFNLHECLAANLPTVASLDFGLNDIMRQLRPLSISSRSDIKQIIVNVHKGLIDTDALNLKAQSIIDQREAQVEVILEKWHELLVHGVLPQPKAQFSWIHIKAILRAYVGWLKFFLNIMKTHFNIFALTRIGGNK